MHSALRIGLLLVIGLAGLGLRLTDWREVFRPWGVAFVDGDCYARMTRVQLVMEQPGRIIRAHSFENFPAGTRPHTTAPLDYLLALGAWSLQPFAGEAARDWAGAWLGPVCYLGIFLSLATWLRRLDWPADWWAGPALFAFSPIVVHGTDLGRPDHQALLLVLLAAAVIADATFLRQASRFAVHLSGLAWGFALWTSLYEPLLLFLATRLVFAWWQPRRIALSAATTGAVLLLALLLEGWRLELSWLRGTEAEVFARWSAHIGELASQPPWSWTMFGWLGGFLLLIPLAPVLGWKQADRGEVAIPLLFLLLLALTCWQARWGYFAVLGIALALPLSGDWKLRGRSLLLALCLVPVLVASYVQWRNPDETRGLEADRLHAVALEIRDEALREPRGRHSILAPWWLCPPLAYWSGQPAIGGSSHQSIGGALDAERFLTSTNDAEAFTIIRRRRVRWIVIDSVDRLVMGAFYPENFAAQSLDLRIRHHPARVPAFLQLPVREVGRVYDSPLSLLRVQPEYLAP